MPRFPRKPSRRKGGRLTRRRERQRLNASHRTRGTAATCSRRPKASRAAFGTPVAMALPMPVATLIEPTATFLADAPRLLTELQLQALKVHILRDAGKVFFDAGAARIRYVRFEGFRVWVVDDLSARKVILVGIEPDTDNDPKPPTAKLRKALRWVLDRTWALGAYAVVKWLRDLLNLRNTTDTIAFSEHAKESWLMNCARDHAFMHTYECNVSRVADPLQENHLVLESFEDLEVIGSWIVRNQGVSTDNDRSEPAKLVLDGVALEDSFIRDLLNENCLDGRHPSVVLRSSTDIAIRAD